MVRKKDQIEIIIQNLVRKMNRARKYWYTEFTFWYVKQKGRDESVIVREKKLRERVTDIVTQHPEDGKSSGLY